MLALRYFNFKKKEVGNGELLDDKDFFELFTLKK